LFLRGAARARGELRPADGLQGGASGDFVGVAFES